MRRISIALALVGAVAAAGCGGAGGSTPASSSANPGLDESTFKVVVRGENAFWDPATSTTVILPKGGVVTSGVGGISCGVDGAGVLHKVCSFDAVYATTVVLTGTSNIAGWVHGWAGACAGTANTCSVFVSSNRLAVIRFAATTSALGAHPNFTDPAVHVIEYMKYGKAGAFICTDCHGATLQGQGIAPSCMSCHARPAYPPPFDHPTDGTFAAPASHGPGWVSSASTCAACHGGAGLAGTTWSPACTGCHPIPHVPGAWAAPNHSSLDGAALASCAPCHESTWGGNDVRLAKSCTGCHTMTHEATYTTHGLDYVANTNQCRYCHSTPQSASGTLNGGITAPSCAAANCHSAAGTLPHAVSYPAADHGAAYVANAVDCKGCHGTLLDGATPPLTAPSCSTCHAAPHEVGVMAAPAHTWVALAAEGTATCTACHDAASAARLAPGCTSCHTFQHRIPYDDIPGEHGWQYAADQAIGTISCTGCHGADLAGATAPLTAPSCTNCHDLPSQTSKHFLATETAWGNHTTGWGQSCQRCHTSDGFRDYIGVIGDGNNLSGSFNSSNTITAGTGLPGAYGYGPLTCNVCHNPQSEPTNGFTGLTQVRFPSMNLVSVDKMYGLCSQCHQARNSTPGINSYINTLVASGKGLGTAPVTATGGTAGIPGTSTATLTATGLVASAYKGFTAIFSGNVTQALNGVRCGVVDNTTSGMTLDCVLPATPGADSVTLYPTVTAGSSTTTLVDANRAWTAGQWAGYYVYFYNNHGAVSAPAPYARITGNGATSLSFVATPTAPVAGQFYLILPNEAPAVLDTQLSGATFQNPHYLGAAATIFGANAAGYYEYPVTYDTVPATRPYLRNGNHATSQACIECHEAHVLEIPSTFNCSTTGCHHTHSGATDQTAAGLRLKTGRWYMDGSTDQGVYQNYLQMMAKLYTAIQRYSLAKGNTSGGTSVICFNEPGASGQYFFVGSAEGEAGTSCPTTTTWGAAGSSTAFTPRLVRATYNYKFLAQDPGAWAHNPRYVAEIMYDAIRDLNQGLAPAAQIDMTGWVRP